MAAKTISSLAIRLSLNSDQVKKGVTQANAGLQRFGDRAGKVNERLRRGGREVDAYGGRLGKLRSVLGSAAGKLAAFAAVVGTVRFALVKLNEQVQVLDEIGKFSERIGITANQLQALRLAAEFSGVAVNSLHTSLQRMTRRIAEAAAGTGTAKGALEQLGLSAQELIKLQPDLQLARIFDQLTKIEDQGTKVALAMKIFDTEGVALLNDEFAFTSEGLAKINGQMAELGLQVSELDTAQAAAVNDSLSEMQLAATGAWRELLKVADSAMVFESIAGIIKDLTALLRSIQPLVMNFANAVGLIDVPTQALPILSRREQARGAELDARIRQAAARVGAGGQGQDRKAESQRDKAYREHQEQTRLARQQLEIERRRLAQPPIQVQTYRLPG